MKPNQKQNDGSMVTYLVAAAIIVAVLYIGLSGNNPTTAPSEITKTEGLTAHAEAMTIRMKNL